MPDRAFINLGYLVASALFIFGIKGLTHPRTAVRGNQLGALGMLVAIVVTLFDRELLAAEPRSWMLLGIGLAVGATAGATLALKVQMTAMPQMVALLNGFGGGASVLVAGGAFLDTDPALVTAQLASATAASGIIGGVTFWGSLVAFDKLQEWLLPGRPVQVPGRQFTSIILLAVAIVLGAVIVRDPQATWAYVALVGVASVLGITVTLPIGGADMPVAIALLNSYSGLAGAATGFVLNNNVLIIAGTLVGASGFILTRIMCRAMNRSLVNVLSGAIAAGSTASEDDVYAGRVKSTSAEEVAMLFDTARRVVVVPGYGLAVSQAQHAVRDLTALLETHGVEVEFAIHPVAGRMPGHMNVLLAEADISYDKLKEMDEINPTFEQTDVALVVGANDVVNPLARTDPKSPIAGMPILDVDKARTVVIVKRSLSPGFAGIPNPLFAADNALMLFQDAKKALTELVAAVKEAA